MQARIIAQGSYLPQRILTNSDLEKMVDTSDEWIVSRTGMKERRLAADDEFASHMGAKAAKKALDQVGMDPQQINMIVVATMTPDHLTPSTAALIQQMIGCSAASAFDLSAACTGYLYALATAKAYVESGMARNVLVIATEKLSAFVDWKERETCVLFGDGAGACIVSSQGEGWIIDSPVLGCDGEQQGLFKIAAGGSREPATDKTLAEGGHYMAMEGKELFRHAVRRMVQAAESCMAKSGHSAEEIDWVVCHQANVRILDAVSDRLQVDSSRVYKTVHKYGNTSASSVAIAFDELCQDPPAGPFKQVLLLAFGAGLTWGSAWLTHTSQKSDVATHACEML